MDVRRNGNDTKEKLGSSIAGRPSDNLAYLPLKKRRPRLRSPSPPPQTPLDGIDAARNSVSSPKPLPSSIENVLVKTDIRTEDSGIELLASVACPNSKSDDVHNAELGVNKEKCTPLKTDVCMDTSYLEITTTDASNSLVEVQKSKSIENAVVKTNLSRTEDSVASRLLAPVACKKNNANNVHNAEIAVKQERLLTPQGIDAYTDMSSLGKTMAGTSRSCIEVQKSQNIENALLKTISGAEETFATRLIASAACNNNKADDVCKAVLSVKQEKLLTPQGIDTCMDMPYLEKIMTGRSKSLVEVRRNQSIENDVLKTNIPNTADSFDKELVASVASNKNNVGNVHGVVASVKQEILLTPEGRDACMDVSSLRKITSGASISLVEVQRSQSTENAQVETNLSGTEDSFSVRLIASDASKKNNAEVGVDQEKLWTDTCVGLSSLERTMTGSREEKCPSLKVPTSEADNDSPDQIDPAIVPLNLLDKAENNAARGFSSEKGFRLHWDLNTVMDNWELPADDQSFGSKENKMKNISSEGMDKAVTDNLDSRIGFDDSVKAWKLSNCTSALNGSPQLKRKLNYLESGSPSEGRINTCTKLPMLAREKLCTSEMQLGQTLSVKNIKLEKQDHIRVVPAVLDKSICDMVRIKSEHEPVKLCAVKSTGNTVSKVTIPAGADNLSGKSDRAFLPNVSSHNMTITTPVTTLDECQPVPVYLKKQNELYSPTKVSPLRISLSDAEMKELLPKSREQFGPPKIALGNPSSDDVITELMSESGEQFVPPKVASLVNHSSDVAIKELMPKSFEQFVPPKIAGLVNSSSDVVTKELMPKSFEQFGPPKIATNIPSSGVETNEPISMSYEQLGSPKISTTVNHSPVVETKELMPRSREHSGEVALEDPLDDGDVSDLSLGGHNHSVSLVKEAQYPIGYESPFEDGEFRETDVLSWEENEDETERVDYDMDDRDAYEYGTGNLYMSEAGSQSIQNEDNSNLMEKGACRSVNSVKESSTSTSVENVSGQDQIVLAGEANNCKTDEMVISDSIRKLDAKGSFTKEMRSKTMRENLASRVGESPASGSTDEKDAVFAQQRRSGPRFEAGPVFRSAKYLAGDRHIPQMHDERRKYNWNGSSSSFLDSRNHFQNKYQRGGAYPLPRSNVPDSETDDYRDQRQSTNYSAKGGYRPFVRKRPLDNSDKDFSSQRRNMDPRDDVHGLLRSRTGIYHRGGFRGPRGNENHGPISNDSAPSSAYMQARRRSSCSPILNRNPSFSRPCRRSRSRSRTRSPISWRMQEERNKAKRMERTRMLYNERKFEENDDAFCSPPRKRYSSHSNSGSFNDRAGGPSRFRERNSPGRFVGQRERFDSRGSVERMKSDEGFRPRIPPQRFSKPSGEVWRGHNHDNNNNERTKYNDRSEMINRGGRQGDNNGAFRRFHKDEEESFDGHHSRNNKCWDGRGPFKYDRERH